MMALTDFPLGRCPDRNEELHLMESGPDFFNKLRKLLPVDKKTGIGMIQDIEHFFGGKPEIDRGKDTPGSGGTKKDFNKRNRIEQEDGYFLPFL